MVYQYVRAAIKQYNYSPLNPWICRIYGHEALAHTSSKFLRRTASQVVFSDAGLNMYPAIAFSLTGIALPLPGETVRCSIARWS